jgi:hypothetical protein
MGKKSLLLLLSVFICSINAIAKTDYYYYQGSKIPLTLNEKKIVLSIPKDCTGTIGRIKANVVALDSIKDQYFDIIIISRSDYDIITQLDYWKESQKTVILTSCYYTEKNEEVFATPYLNVKLKNDQDFPLLSSFVEQNNLRIVGNSSLMPLWYIISITPNSEKNTLECANELFESGTVESSAPDLASFMNEMSVRLIMSKPLIEFEAYYDLRGHRINSPSGLTIVVTRYSDGTVRTEKRLFK